MGLPCGLVPILPILLLVGKVAQTIPTHIPIEVPLLILAVHFPHDGPSWVDILAVHPIDVLEDVHKSQLVFGHAGLGTPRCHLGLEAVSRCQLVEVLRIAFADGR